MRAPVKEAVRSFMEDAKALRRPQRAFKSMPLPQPLAGKSIAVKLFSRQAKGFFSSALGIGVLGSLGGSFVLRRCLGQVRPDF